MENAMVFVSHEDIFEATDQIRSKKKQWPDIKGIFNYLRKMKKLEFAL